MDGAARAREHDERDPLAPFRNRFVGDSATTYLDGNSLGRMPYAAGTAMDSLRRGWGDRLIRGWNDGWVTLPRRVGDKIGALIGAGPGQTVVSDSTSTNLYKLAHAAIHGRRAARILTDDLNFPSDLYILQGLTDELTVVGTDGHSPNSKGLREAIEQGVDLVSLSAVAFRSGALYDVQTITRLAHDHGALVLWDLSHAAGAVELRLDEWQVDLAVGCTYKYLNGGPGAPAFQYVSQSLQDSLRSPIQGWFGQRNAFAFDLEYEPAVGIDRFLAGTPFVASMALIEPGVELLLEAGMEALLAKSAAMTSFLVELYDAHLAQRGFSLQTPRAPSQRGSHVAFAHSEAWRINRALIDLHGVIPDFRAPDVIRFAAVPIYGTFYELWRGVEALAHIIDQRSYERFPPEISGVT